MEYEVCYMNSLGLLTIVFYKTLKDYDSDKPAVIYIITQRRNKKEALNKARILERRYPNTEIKILIEGKDKEEIDKVIDECLEASKTLSPSIW
jgi:predicted metal-dependent TIM-barrel fold hydrolase